MARPPQITPEILRALLRLRGPVSATELASTLKVNRTTIARALPDLGEQLVTLGATRSSRYLLRRALRNGANRWPIYQIDSDGRANDWAELEAFHETHWRINWAGSPPAWAHHFLRPDGLWHGFPFFLADLRPQGFLGRAIVRHLAIALQLPSDFRRWNDDDTLFYLQSASDDLPGNLVLGDECLRRALGRATSENPQSYLAHAEQAANVQTGSSAGGEQPKFLTTRDDQPVLVKFSPDINQPIGQRWGDLLLCEYHALTVLGEAGLATAGARILDEDERRFLEVPRFDRTGTGGRRGVVSLEALHSSAADSYARTWPEAAANLQKAGLLDASGLVTVRRLHAFGELIGNTDMHFGNLAFWMDHERPFRVAPAYDMLPMLWAPTPQGELLELAFAPLPPVPADREIWLDSARLAVTFWQRVAADSRLSDSFRQRAEQCRAFVENLQRRVG